MTSSPHIQSDMKRIKVVMNVQLSSWADGGARLPEVYVLAALLFSIYGNNLFAVLASICLMF